MLGATPTLPVIQVVGPFWRASVTVLAAPLNPATGQDWVIQARDLFLDSTPRAAAGFDKAYLPGTMMALCYVKTVIIQPTPTFSYQWENQGTPPATNTPDAIRQGINAGTLALLLLQTDAAALAKGGSVEYVCLAREIVLDKMTETQPGTLSRLRGALALAVPSEPVRWEAVVHSGGLSIYGAVTLPWQPKPTFASITLPFQLALELPLTGAPSPAMPTYRMTIEAERLTTDEQIAVIMAWRNLSRYINPLHPLNDLPPANIPLTPVWMTFEIANPVGVPRIFWQVTQWTEKPIELLLQFEPSEINLLISDQQPYDPTDPPASLARITPTSVIVKPGEDGLQLEVNAESKNTSGGGHIHYSWGHDNTTVHEQFDFADMKVAFDPVETPEILRADQSLPTPEWLPGSNAEPISPAVIWGFMPLEDGWAQLPFLNLTAQMYLDAKLANFTDAQTHPAPFLMQGAAAIGNDHESVLGFYSHEQPWNVTLSDAEKMHGVWTLKLQRNGYVLDGADVKFDGPEVFFNGLFWLSTDSPDNNDALPDFSDWVSGLRAVTLKTVDPEFDLFPSPTVFSLADFSFSLRKGDGITEAKRPSALLNLWEFTYQIDNTIWNEMRAAKVVPADAFKLYAPLLWRHHPSLPMIQALPLTQSKSPPNYPNASRQLVPFKLDLTGDLPDGWRFVVGGSNAAARWSEWVGAPVPAEEWQSLFDLPLVALSLPGMQLDPAADPDKIGLGVDPALSLPLQYRFDLPYLDQLNALTQLPPTPRDPKEVSPLPDEKPPLPPLPLTREKFAEYWARLATQSSLASADAIEAFQLETGQAYIQHLAEPFRWPVRPDVALQQYPGSMTVDNADAAQSAPLLLAAEAALRGISGAFTLEADNTLRHLTGQGGEADFHLEAGSMYAQAGNGFYRDQRGLLRSATTQSATSVLLQTPVHLHTAAGTASYLLTSLLNAPLRFAITDKQNWQFWFHNLPIAADSTSFLRSFATSPQAITLDTDINDPEALSPDFNFLTGYEWRLGEGDATNEYRLLGGLWFYPLTLEVVKLAGEQVTQVEIIGRLQLPLKDTDAELTDLGNAVRLTFGTKTGMDGLVLTGIECVSPYVEWPLALHEGGELADAPLLTWKIAQLNAAGDSIEIDDIELHYFLFGVEWTVNLEKINFPLDGSITSLSRTYTFDAHLTDSLYPKSVALNLELTEGLHRAAFTLAVQMGDRTVDGLLLRYDFREGLDPAVVKEQAGTLNAALDLTIQTPSAAEWDDEGLHLKAATRLSASGAGQVAALLGTSKEVTVEAWMTPADLNRTAPIFTLQGATAPELVLEQQAKEIVFHTRLTSAAEETVRHQVDSATLPYYVVYTRDVWGIVKLYINGNEEVSLQSSGDLVSSEAAYQLLFANNAAGNTPWLGSLHGFALYNRALSVDEVKRRYGQGAANTALRTAFITDVEFPLLGGEITWKNPKLFDDIAINTMSTADATTIPSVAYYDRSLLFNWQHYQTAEGDDPIQLMPGMLLDETHMIPGFATLTFMTVDSFTLADSFAGDLAVLHFSDALQTAFLNAGVKVSQLATITAESGGWRIQAGRTAWLVRQIQNRKQKHFVVYAEIPELVLQTAYVETLLTCAWGSYLQENPFLGGVVDTTRAFGSSAGHIAFSYTAMWNTQDANWDETFLLNGFVEIKNLISWPTGMVYDPAAGNLTLPAAKVTPALAHTRHTIRVLLNQHEIPREIPVVGEGSLIFNFAQGKPWQFLSVVEHQLADLEFDSGKPGWSAGNDRRWTALQEVRFILPKTYRDFLDRVGNSEVVLPVSLPRQIVLTRPIDSAGNDVNEDGNDFTPGGNSVWIGTGTNTQKSYTGLRFTGVNIPRGAVITSAKLQFWSAADKNWIQMDLEIGADANGNSPAFSTTSRPSGRTLTKARVTHSSNLNWPLNMAQDFDEIAPVIQEVVTRADWNSGNSLSLILRGTGKQFGRKYVAAFEGDAAHAVKLTITYSVSSSDLLTLGYFTPAFRKALISGTKPELAQLPSDTFLVEASAPHWIRQTPAVNVNSTTLQFLPFGTQLAILSTPSDFLPTDPHIPGWLLLTMPFLGRLQDAACDCLDKPPTALPATLQIDPVFDLERRRNASPADALPATTLALSSWADSQPVSITIADFDTAVGRLYARLDPLTLEENWFRLQMPLSEPPSKRLQSIIAALPATPARFSRSLALRRAADSFRPAYPPALADNYYPPSEDVGDQIVWRQHNLMVIQTASKTAGGAPYSWYAIGVQLQGSGIMAAGTQPADTPTPPRRYPSATLLPTSSTVDGAANRMPVSFAVSPYLGLEFLAADANSEPRVKYGELLGIDNNSRQIRPVASYLWEYQAHPVAEGTLPKAGQQELVDMNWADWTRQTHARLSPDSPVAILRFRQVNKARSGEAQVTTAYSFDVITELNRREQLARHIFRMRSIPDQLRYRQGQYGGIHMPPELAAFELAPAQTVGVQPLYLTESLDPHESWPWGMSAMRLSVQYTHDKQGAVSAIEVGMGAPIKLWWQFVNMMVQYRSALRSERPVASLPPHFRARAIKSLQPTLPNPPMPDAFMLDIPDITQPDKLKPRWQSVLPGAVRYLVTGSRAGVMFAFRNALIRQEGVRENGKVSLGVGTLSGSLPVQHRFPRPVPLPPNDTAHPLTALQTWASFFEPTRNALVTDTPADEAFFAAFENQPFITPADRKPAHRLQVRLIQPQHGVMPPNWNGEFIFEMNAEQAPIRIWSWQLGAVLVNNNQVLSLGTPTPLQLAKLDTSEPQPGVIPHDNDTVRELFAQNGLGLAITATIASDRRWLLDDLTSNQQYLVYEEGEVGMVFSRAKIGDAWTYVDTIFDRTIITDLANGQTDKLRAFLSIAAGNILRPRQTWLIANMEWSLVDTDATGKTTAQYHIADYQGTLTIFSQDLASGDWTALTTLAAGVATELGVGNLTKVHAAIPTLSGSAVLTAQLRLDDPQNLYWLEPDINGGQNIFGHYFRCALQDVKQITGGTFMATMRVRHITTTTGFLQNLNFPLRAADQVFLPLPLQPAFIHFEDPEYNRRLASAASHAPQVAKVNITVNGQQQEVSHTVTLSADRKEYNADSDVALRYDWDDYLWNGSMNTVATLNVDRISPNGSVTTIWTESINSRELKRINLREKVSDYNLAHLKDVPVEITPGDSLQIKVRLLQSGIPHLSDNTDVVLIVPIVAKPVTPVPEAGYALLRAQLVDDNRRVECACFAWSPEATRIEMVCADDLLTEVVRRRAIFHWLDPVRPNRHTRHAIQKITFTGSTHFPNMIDDLG